MLLTKSKKASDQNKKAMYAALNFFVPKSQMMLNRKLLCYFIRPGDLDEETTYQLNPVHTYGEPYPYGFDPVSTKSHRTS